MQVPDKEDDFDDLIREAGDKYQASGASADWEGMNTLLDKHMPARKGRRRSIFVLLILLFLLWGGGYLFLIKTNDKRSAPGKQQQVSVKPSDHSEPSEAIEPITKSAARNNNTRNQTPLLQNKEPLQKENEVRPKRSTRSTNKIAGQIKVNTYMGETGENNPPAKTVDDAGSANTNEIRKDAGDSATEILPQTKIAVPGENNSVAEEKAAPEIPAKENKIPTDPKNTAGNKKNKTNLKSKNPFEFSILYAPELTSIRFSYIDKPGSNFGLLIGYHISDAIAIQTGIIKSRKNYIANGRDFKSRRPQSPNNKLYKVDGYCMMYEIPLNIKAQILKRRKSNLFVTAGISSYIMESEFYNYYYTTPYGDSSRSAKFNSQNNYWLSLATVGVGLEKNITNTLNIGVMPFIKIPFKGMGRGSLKLLGTGINFSLTYRPPFGKK